MQLRSITAAPDIKSLRIRTTILSEYEEFPSLGSRSTLLTEARRDPLAIQTTHSTNGGEAIVQLIVPGALWTRRDGSWEPSDVGDLPNDWALNAYRELGDMSLVAPLTAQVVVDAGQVVGAEVIGDVPTTHITADTGLMIRLLMGHFNKSDSSHDPVPPDSYINRYECDLRIDPATGFVIQERTVVEYTEERLHGQTVGTGPATFTTTREFYDLNAEIEIPDPSR